MEEGKSQTISKAKRKECHQIRCREELEHTYELTFYYNKCNNSSRKRKKARGEKKGSAEEGGLRDRERKKNLVD